jgi:hypothetical protein
MDTASVILLLISSDFLASDYCYGVEMQKALERHHAGTAHVVPILLRPVDWCNAQFAHLSCLPSNERPITSWTNLDEAFLDVAIGIRTLLENVYGLPSQRAYHNFARLTGLHATEPSSISSSDPIKEYLEVIAKDPFYHLAIRPLPQPFSPDQLHWPVQSTLLPLAQLSDTADEHLKRGLPQIAQTQEWEQIRTCIQKSVIILGESGSGKSLLLLYENYQSARKQLANISQTSLDNPDIELPLYIPLEHLPDAITEEGYSQAGAFKILAQAWAYRSFGQWKSDQVLPAVIEWLTSERRCLFLFDGYEKIKLSGDKREVFYHILKTIRLRENIRYITTDRRTAILPIAYQIEDRYEDYYAQKVQIMSLSQPDIAQFVTTWFSSNAARGQEFLQTLTMRQFLGDLAKIPLYLSYLCQIAQNSEGHLTEILPFQRTTIYEAILSIQLDQYHIDKKQAKSIIVKLFQGQLNSGDVWQVKEADVKKILTEYELQILLKAKILLPHGRGSFGFLHDSFHEYLLALAFSHLTESEIWNWGSSMNWFHFRVTSVVIFLINIKESAFDMDHFIQRLIQSKTIFNASIYTATSALSEYTINRNISHTLKRNISQKLSKIIRHGTEAHQRIALLVLWLLDADLAKKLTCLFIHGKLHWNSPDRRTHLDNLLTVTDIFVRVGNARNDLRNTVILLMSSLLRSKTACKDGLHFLAIDVLHYLGKDDSVYALIEALQEENAHCDHWFCQERIIDALKYAKNDVAWRALAHYWAKGNPSANLLRCFNYDANGYLSQKIVPIEPVARLLALINSLIAQRHTWGLSAESTPETSTLSEEELASIPGYFRRLLSEAASLQKELDDRALEQNPELVQAILSEFAALPRDKDLLRVASDNMLHYLGGQCALMAFLQLLKNSSPLEKAMGAWGINQLLEKAGIWQASELPEKQRDEILQELLVTVTYDNPKDAKWIYEAHSNATEALERLSNEQAISSLISAIIFAKPKKDQRRDYQSIHLKCILASWVGFFSSDINRQNVRQKVYEELLKIKKQRNGRNILLLLKNDLHNIWLEDQINRLLDQTSISHDERICHCLTRCNMGTDGPLLHQGKVKLPDYCPSNEEGCTAIFQSLVHMNQKQQLDLLHNFLVQTRNPPKLLCPYVANMQALAVKQIAGLEKSACQAELLSYLDDPEQKIVIAAAQELGKMEKFASLGEFVNDLYAQDPQSCWKALLVIQHSKRAHEPRIISQVVELLHSNNEQIRSAAEQYLYAVEDVSPAEIAAYILADYQRTLSDQRTVWISRKTELAGKDWSIRADILVRLCTSGKTIHPYIVKDMLYKLILPRNKMNLPMSFALIQLLKKDLLSDERIIRICSAILLSHLDKDQITQEMAKIENILFDALKIADLDGVGESFGGTDFLLYRGTDFESRVLRAERIKSRPLQVTLIEALARLNSEAVLPEMLHIVRNSKLLSSIRLQAVGVLLRINDGAQQAWHFLPDLLQENNDEINAATIRLSLDMSNHYKEILDFFVKFNVFKNYHIEYQARQAIDYIIYNCDIKDIDSIFDFIVKCFSKVLLDYIYHPDDIFLYYLLERLITRQSLYAKNVSKIKISLQYQLITILESRISSRKQRSKFPWRAVWHAPQMWWFFIRWRTTLTGG